MKKRKTYRLKINPKQGAEVSAIAMVEEPAIESNFLAFSKQQPEAFATNDDKQELIGAALIPDHLIYRKDKKTGEEYDVYFTAEDIREIAQQYMKYGYQNNMNLGHTSIPAKSFIYQSFIVDSSKGVTAPKGIDVPDGSWIVGVKVDDGEVWNNIKEGKIKGFSIEGVFDFLEVQMSNEEDYEAELSQLLNQINNIITKNKKN